MTVASNKFQHSNFTVNPNTFKIFGSAVKQAAEKAARTIWWFFASKVDGGTPILSFNVQMIHMPSLFVLISVSCEIANKISSFAIYFGQSCNMSLYFRVESDLSV